MTAAIVLIWRDDAWAYIDPATTSYFLQWLLAGLLAAALALRMFWRSVRAFFARMFGRRAESPVSSDNADRAPDEGDRE